MKVSARRCGLDRAHEGDGSAQTTLRLSAHPYSAALRRLADESQGGLATLQSGRVERS